MSLFVALCQNSADFGTLHKISLKISSAFRDFLSRSGFHRLRLLLADTGLLGGSGAELLPGLLHLVQSGLDSLLRAPQRVLGITVGDLEQLAAALLGLAQRQRERSFTLPRPVR